MNNFIFLAGPAQLLGMVDIATVMTFLSTLGLAVLVWIVGGFIINKVVALAGMAMDRSKMDASLKPFLKSVLNAILKVMLLLAVASTLGMQVTSFVAILSAAAFAVGMALQGGLSNFAGGVMILTFRPFKVGDVISAQGHTGGVQEIQIFHTVLLTPDLQTIIIPNGPLSNGVINNLTMNPTRLVALTYGIGYDDDIDQARAAILKVLKKCPHVIDPEKTGINVSSLGDSCVNFSLRAATLPEHYWTVMFYMNEHVKKEFDAQNIGIPFPQMDVHVKKD